MARPRTFDEERALDAAVWAFWVKGYEATSTQDLCSATGLGRSSIYNTFSSKHELFTRALARYMDVMTAGQVAVLEQAERPVMERLRALFDVVIDGEFERRVEGRSVGCLTVNTTVEIAGRDPEVAALLARDLERRLASFRGVIEAGQRAGEISTARDADSLARFINAVIGGMRVSAQGGADRAVLESVADTALVALSC
ncbi:TetR/AcrR family transcriptional regulator [Streptomyces sp. AC536]|uniref:TetR/AcrR family transcriptional regulator n=1 Tax=Streptomyces buecherae TaxID=2763006 RepID=UPI00164E2C3C|nr:TetR/AcrR family transcriptional regulator [Streptomyces buecherae]MBC3982258.1 TetR/AcrR family transcriptional regulator [Streptomyces buecherae]QNJ40368.1 TetR/AcrR family transcriptional regulator [Streptomyces buecherae]